MKSRLLIILLLGTTILCISCSSTTLTGSWKNPEYNKSLDRIYIVGVSKNDTTRRIFEDTFNDKLYSLGVTGIVSYKDIPKNEDDKDLVRDKALKNQADSILISRMVKKRAETVVNPGRVTTFGDSYYPYPYYRSYNTYYTRRYETIYEPPSITQYQVATIESNLYDIDSGELIWSAQLETTIEGNLQKMIHDFISVVISDMKLKGLL